MRRFGFLIVAVVWSFNSNAQIDFDGGLLGTGTNWETATNWDGNTLPLDSADVVIPDHLLAYNVSINSAVIVNNLDLNDNNLTIETGASLVVYGTIDMAAFADLTVDGSLILKEGASIIQSTLADVHGDVVIQRDGTIEDFVYNYWSSPVVGETFRDVFLSFDGPDVDSNDLYYFDHTVQNDDTTGSNSGWTQISPNDVMPAMEGCVATGIEYDIGTPTREFIGEPNNGTMSLDFTISSLVNGSYFVLTGNPYPSAIDLNLFLAANAAFSEVYLWDDDNGTNTRNDYITANILGATGGRSGVTDVDYIGSAQGFFVDAALLGAVPVSILYTNAIRVAANNNQFFRKADEVAKIYLNIESELGEYGNQTLIGFHPEATLDRDENLDSRKLDGNTYVSLYSKMLGDLDERLAIQSLPELVDITIIPLGLNLSIDEEFAFSIDHVNLDEEAQVILLDKLTGVSTNLLLENYMVLLSSGDYDNRFELMVVVPSNEVGITEHSNSYKMFENNGFLNLEMSHAIDVSVEVFDAAGRIVKSFRNSDKINRFDLNDLSSGIYLVNVSETKGKQLFSDKILLRK